MNKRLPTTHSMHRRNMAHDYSRPGSYHITLHVADGIAQLLGRITGSPTAPDESPEAPHVVLSAIGQAVEHELLHSITAHYPMITVDVHVIMPEHLHAILIVHDNIISSTGRPAHLGQVIAGFKKGCNRAFWALTAQAPASPLAGEPPSTVLGAFPAPTTPGAFPAPTTPGAFPVPTVPGGLPAGSRPPSDGSSGRQPLFSKGYCDVMPLDAAQLAVQRAYILNNPRSRLLRTTNRAWLQPQRHAVTTALTVSALCGYLQRECGPTQASRDALAAITRRLLTAPAAPLAGEPPSTVPAAPSVPGAPAASTAPSAPAAPTVPGGLPAWVACDTYGNPALLRGPRLLPVVCHRRDKARFAEQKTRCLEAAAAGAILISPRIAKGEQDIIDAAADSGFPVVIIADNGFPQRYHPSTERLDRCAAGRLLIVTPWQYEYRRKDDAITVLFCKTMNCVAQALCRRKDNWWQQPVTAPSVSSTVRCPADSSPASTLSTTEKQH